MLGLLPWAPRSLIMSTTTPQRTGRTIAALMAGLANG